MRGDCYAASQAQHEVKCRFLLDVVVGQRAAILELLAGKDQTLLIRWNALLVLYLCFHVFDRVRTLHLEGNGLAGQGLHKDLHAPPRRQAHRTQVLK